MYTHFVLYAKAISINNSLQKCTLHYFTS